MTTAHPWKLSIADAYANRYGEVAQDFLNLVVEPALAGLDRKAVELAKNPDQAIASIQALDHINLTAKTSMALCLGIQSVWEQQLRSYLRNCIGSLQLGDELQKRLDDVKWGDKMNSLFLDVRGIDFQSFDSYGHLDLLQTLGNVCRHGEGKSAMKLRKNHTGLWPHWADTVKYPNVPVTYRAPVDGIRIPVGLLRELVNAVVLFWLDMRRLGTESLLDDQPGLQGEVESLLARRTTFLPSRKPLI
ncbi:MULTISPECIES: hypothetical protein [unclassified Pseudomonas]|uniref:hypothetical protein n=1 Tax=unclassified Pseudomonas TaxID=196821 RepID=UPI001F5AF5AE|nr:MULTISPECIES: hypothetical protein [unclassified Pseudomonas]